MGEDKREMSLLKLQPRRTWQGCSACSQQVNSVKCNQRSSHCKEFPDYFFSKLRPYFEDKNVHLMVFHRGMVEPSFVSFATFISLANSYRNFCMWRNSWFKTYVGY